MLEGTNAVLRAAKAETTPEIFAGLKIIDTDTHYTEPADHWTRNAPAKFKDRVPQARTADGVTKWFIDGDTEFGTLGTTVVSRTGDKLLGKISYDNFEEMHEGAWDTKKRLAFMDASGIWAQIMFPNASGFASTKFMGVEDVDLRLESLRLYNTGVLEVQAESNNRLLPQALLPVWDMPATLDEMKRCKDLGVTGFTVADNPEATGLPHYLDPYWEPFWDFLNQTRLPLDFHIGGSGVIDARQIPWSAYGFERNLAIAATMFYMTNAGTVANFMLSGLFDTYEHLTIVSTESGVGWLPFVIEALEYQYDEMIPTEMQHIKLRPREYFEKHIYACFWFESNSALYAINEFDGNNLMFETDFPHPTCLYPTILANMAETLKDQSPERIRKVMQDNAAAVYHLEV